MTNARLTAEQLRRIDLEARRLRAETIRNGFHAIGVWFRGLFAHGDTAKTAH